MENNTILRPELFDCGTPHIIVHPRKSQTKHPISQGEERTDCPYLIKSSSCNNRAFVQLLHVVRFLFLLQPTTLNLMKWRLLFIIKLNKTKFTYNPAGFLVHKTNKYSKQLIMHMLFTLRVSVSLCTFLKYQDYPIKIHVQYVFFFFSSFLIKC